jgi:hypothetical protein
MFGLAALAAVAAMAFIGASSASATFSTTLCSVDTANLECPNNQVSHVHQVSAKANTFLLNEVLNVSCIALFLGDTVGGTLNNPLVISGAFTYTSCTFGCHVLEKNGPATIKVLKTAAELAEVTGKGLVNVNCFGFINCDYIGDGLVGHGLGGLAINPTSGGPGHVTFPKVLVQNESGGECPEPAFLDALYVSLNAEYIRS